MEQYQHFIPQFLLRNFSHPYEAPKEKRSKKRGEYRYEKGKHPGDKVLNVVDLTSDEPRLLESPVSRWFGQEAMYKDFADAIKSKKEVEQELSKLECCTAQILHKIKKAHENSEPGIWLTRVERNRLRKFLFIMKYRGPGFYEKYMSEDPQMYDSEDKRLLRAYMTDNGMTRPRDVWLHNLRTILDLDMDSEGKWMTQLPTLMFPADAQMFVFHAHYSYMAFCTPTAKHDEFLLTDQCYNVFEGPNNETFCAKTGEYYGNTYLCYHEFGPVTPRLIIVLRSNILPEALEDADPSIRKSREIMLDAVATQFPDPEKVKSILSDLPVAKATNSYTRVVDGRLELAPGASGTSQSSDKFCFRFWPISTKHVDTINSIFLDNLLRCKSVVFASAAPFKRTLEAYMSTSAYGFKTVGTGEHGARNSRLVCLEKLSSVLKLLGSKTVPVWFTKDQESRGPFIQSFDDVWLEMMKRILRDGEEFSSESEKSPFLQTYHVLGGSRRTFVNDLDQSWRLYKLQALVYTLTMNLDIGLQRKARMNVLDLIHRTHPRRVWLYVKHRRWMLSDEYAMRQEIFIGTAPLYAAKTEALFRAEREDEVIRSKPTTDQRLLSALIVAAGVFEAK
ncbi:uncharacterized protein Z520_06574 [Fonsecaea multimorphosa CBS 102226]|uniref:DUF4238 domain-containing protein n=1 Tax=Fonsecaea multimorphosa CBS 102226 TaxID=1442371 RepID=A0A0D2IL94_9EURO|nr:uncharacterized protein Z520_06574 [Fonsecaea multimorphosa CBS 102226]KIX97796.1 hypothetical protein Z520_06574 [Fonsecaea multimorphosa CBS 102226]OAL23816.1 hypothetical protein AYO22_06135 [Fonsecaea multimorphosa]